MSNQNIQQYPLGRLAAPDERDNRFLMAAVAPDAPLLYTSIEYRRGPILTQEGPTCVGHGWRAWLSGAPIMQKSGPSAIDLYHAAQELDEWDGTAYEGTSVRGGAKALQAMNLIGFYVWGHDEPTVNRWMRSGKGGVVIGVEWRSAMFKPDAQGYLNLEGSVEGGHCVWVRGYNKPRDAYRIQNSWGVAWGQGGMAWLRAADLNTLLSAGGEACCGVEIRAK